MGGQSSRPPLQKPPKVQSKPTERLVVRGAVPSDTHNCKPSGSTVGRRRDVCRIRPPPRSDSALRPRPRPRIEERELEAGGLTSRLRSVLPRRWRLPTLELRHPRWHPCLARTRRSRKRAPRPRGCRAASGRSLLCRSNASTDATPRRGSPKAEPAARRWLVRYLSEGTPSLRDVAKATASLASASSERRAGRT